MVLEILCVESIYSQYSGALETCLALRYWFFEVLGSESVKGYWLGWFADGRYHVNTFLLLVNRHHDKKDECFVH